MSNRSHAQGQERLVTDCIEPRVVLAHGCFDVLHLGHIRHLKEARDLGDELIVSVTPDAHVNKGEGRPVFSAAERAEALRALIFVGAVFINDSADAVSAIEKVKPAVYVKGMDYADKLSDETLDRECAAVERIGGRIEFTSSAKWSSSKLISHERLAPDVAAYLRRARERGFLDQIKQAFARADQLSVAFVGETIIDEYRYVKGLAKPSKEFILATVETKPSESFLGGVVAASAHADWPRTSVITMSGDPLRKTRFVDSDFSRKLFEVYSAQTIALEMQALREAFQVKLIAAARDADVVVVLDFGHGLMGAKERHIVESAKFLALNAQTNAGNHGFNPVTKYRGAHYVCLDEPEARLAARMQYEPMDKVTGALAIELGCARLVVTHGRYGALADGMTVPALASRGVDTIGAGDAFLAVTAPLIAAGLDGEPAALVGNIAGALKVEIVGHRAHVSRKAIIDRLESLLA